MSRMIGIVHRVKRTRKMEAHPTKVAILRGDNDWATYELDDDDAELDFVKGQFPVAWRKVVAGEDVSGFNPYHCKWRKLKMDEEAASMLPGYVRTRLNEKGLSVCEVLTHLPTAFDGLSPGDCVAISLGSSGNRLAAALSRQGATVGAKVYWISPNVLKDRRGSAEKSDDHLLLARDLHAKLWISTHDTRPFYLVRPRDRELIRVRETFFLRQSAQRDRIACGNRILQAAGGRVFLSEDGLWPEGRLEERYREIVDNDAIYQHQLADESRYEREMHEAVRSLAIWPIFDQVQGCGPRIAAGLIAAICDIRRFLVDPDPAQMDALHRECRRLERRGNFTDDLDKVAGTLSSGANHFEKLQKVRAWKHQNGKAGEAALLEQAIACHRKRSRLRQKARDASRAKLKAFCGAYPRIGGKWGDDVPVDEQFPRQRRGENAGYNPLARQSLYLLGDQFNRNPASEWGRRLLAKKIRLREAHPEEVEVEVVKNGRKERKKRYTDGHIHRMALWATRSKFVEWLLDAWSKVEEEAARAGGNGG